LETKRNYYKKRGVAIGVQWVASRDTAKYFIMQMTIVPNSYPVQNVNPPALGHIDSMWEGRITEEYK
jgi:hypothetical protein